MSGWAKKRFWKEATAQEQNGGFAVLLDGRSVRTPGKAALIVPSLTMAQAITEEWDAQEGELDPATMPVTRSANAAIDKVAVQHAEVAAMIAAYAETDLLCHRADTPAELVARQEAGWAPLLQWAAEKYDAPLSVTTGILPVDQPAKSLARFRAEVDRFDAFGLTALHDLVSLSGSLVIGLAAANGTQGDIKALWDISRIDELWQIEKWGEDDEATALSDSKFRDFQHALRFFRLISQ